MAFQFFAPRRFFPRGKGHSSLRSYDGFSLVEVVLALGLCSFVLIAVMGLMAVSLQSSRQAVQITQTGKLVQGVSSHLLQAGFTNLTNASPNWDYDYEGVVSTNNNTKYYSLKATPLPGIVLPGSGQTNTNFIRFKIVTSTIRTNEPAITNILTVADTGY
jgi:uncharacterized protein (TIGR02598 family)